MVKIHWNENPLRTRVELDYHGEKDQFKLKLEIDIPKDKFFQASYYLNRRQGDIDLDKARRAVDEKFIFDKDGDEIGESGLSRQVDQFFNAYISELAGEHLGDCTCVATSCVKCRQPARICRH